MPFSDKLHAFLRLSMLGLSELVEQTIDRATDLLLVLLRDDPIQKQLYVDLEIVNLLIRIMSHCQLLAAKENAVNVPQKNTMSRSTHTLTHIQIVAAAAHFSCPHGSNPFSSYVSCIKHRIFACSARTKFSQRARVPSRSN
jgi:hypothetical protein